MIPASTTTPIIFDSIDFDLANEYDKTTGKFTASNAGYYLVHCGVQYGSGAGDYEAVIMKSGGIVDDSDANGSTGLSVGANVTTVLKVAKGDTLQCASYQTAGASVALALGFNVSVRNTFSAARLY